MLGYIALSLLDGSWGIYRIEDKFSRTLVASGLPVHSAKAIAGKANSSPIFDKEAVIRCGGVWH